MTVKEDIVPTRPELTPAQRAMLEERLRRAKQATSRAGEPRSGIARRRAGADSPLSYAQRRLWFLDQLEPGSPVYNVCQALRIAGPVDVPALTAALNEIVRRHEVLRTNFTAADGTPVQVVQPQRILTVEVAEAADEAEALRRVREESRRPFDLARDLLVRAVLVRVPTGASILLLTLHHIISDGWSLGILFRELAALYPAACTGATGNLPELPIQFADYVAWERETLQGPMLERLLGFWREQLRGPLPVLELPFDHPRATAAAARGAALTLDIPGPVAKALKALAQREGATLFMTLLAAFQTLLHRWTSQDDIVIGSVVAGRRKVELEKLIGFFVNTLVFRGDLAGDPTFRSFLKATRDRALAVLAHQDLPFETLVNDLRPDRAPSRNPLFQVMFVLQNAPMPAWSLGDVTVEPLEVETGTSKFDLTLSMVEDGERLRAGMEYNADLFEPETIRQLLGTFATLLGSIGADPDQRLSRLALLTPAEREQVVTTWNDTRRSYPRDRSLAEVFAAQVAQTPHAPAVTCGARTLTYQQLDAEANRLARRLWRAGVGRETLVAVMMERSAELIVTLVAILKAGGAYVSLDPSYPAERLAYMLRDTAAPVLVVANEAVCERLPLETGQPGPVVLNLTAERAAIANEGTSPLPLAVTAESLAYVSYTSGSTGRPKGVAVAQRGVVRLVKQADFARMGPDEVWLQFAPIAFDASTLEIWAPLLNGGRLIVYPPGRTSLAELGEFIERERITSLWLTAGLFQQMVEHQAPRLRHVRQLLAGGDVLSPTAVARALEALPETTLINGYGPTENTTFTCCHRVTAAGTRSVPIGRPISNTQVYILDAHLQPVPVGVPGELYAGGDGLARGYLNRPELTAERFVANPFAAGERLYRTGDRARWLPDGTIEFLDRVDRQVKIRGFRVEPAEVEAVLAAHPAVKACAVTVREVAGGEKRLVAYVVPAKGTSVATETLRAHLAARLPDYLVPAAFFTLEALPLNANGKLDAAALAAVAAERSELHPSYVAPRDDLERELAAIWESVLDVRPIGLHDSFFALGGHSLLAVRVVAQVEKTLGHRLPVAAIFQHPTVEEMAQVLRAPATAYRPASSIVEIQAQGTRPPLHLVHGVGGGMFWGYANLARHLGTDQPLLAFKSRGLDGLPEWPTIEEMAASYVADLRAAQPHGPYQLGGYCFGGIVAYEMARQLQEQGETVALLALINGSPPNTGYQKDFNRLSPRWLARFSGNFAYWLSCFLFRWTWRERKEFVRWKLRVVRRRPADAEARPHAEVALGDVDQLVDLAAYSEERRALWRTHVLALMKYHPRPYAGRVTLIRTRGHPMVCSFDHEYGWAELARGGVDVHIVRGGHGNVLAEPFVRNVAAVLRTRAERRAGKRGTS
ncbi:non-ribosomal peptide synthetase [Opitutus sp. ER46]|uniref:non-ribosomal peptide synthetase n=1 Tax=Opitutus sp. ER46 TaxID=2161864 RepID=UPI000D317209|nr:non-ribosomal peptide synthetase [Opitutus sp. ER46]PTX92718.1 non-ribosomal peptide synthetase [Opitutus sp. ER46]